MTVSLLGCGSANADRTALAPSPAASGASSPSCAATVASTFGTVAARVYHEAATGTVVAEAVHRVQSSAALTAAINSGDASGARTVLRALLLNQIVRVEILRDGRVLAQAGSGAAIAPVRGSIPGTRASFLLSTQPVHAYLQVVHQVTGSEVLLRSGGRSLGGTIGAEPPSGGSGGGALTLAGQSYQAFTLPGAVYPSGALQIVLLVPSATISCPGPPAQARVETLGHVGERIYQEELHSPAVTATLRHMEGSRTFQRAVANGDVTATRAAIIGFFEAHIHVVRVRVQIGSRLLIDEGGPFVLAPVHGTLRSGGRVVGHFTMAIQDDAGYLKLARLFTGADVLMRTGTRQVMGTLAPGPASVPDRGEVSYRGRTYQADSFVGEAFPDGPLRVSLLLGR